MQWRNVPLRARRASEGTGASDAERGIFTAEGAEKSSVIGGGMGAGEFFVELDGGGVGLVGLLVG